MHILIASFKGCPKKKNVKTQQKTFQNTQQ